MDQSKVIKVLNDLIETSKDGEYGFATSAERVRDPQVQTLFHSRAQECRTAASELQALVRQLGGSAEDSGSTAGALHRGWVAVKEKLTTYTDLAILEEVERGEDTALASYRDALQETLPTDVEAVVQRQFEGVKRNHAQVRALRDQARAADTSR